MYFERKMEKGKLKVSVVLFRQIVKEHFRKWLIRQFLPYTADMQFGNVNRYIEKKFRE